MRPEIPQTWLRYGLAGLFVAISFAAAFVLADALGAGIRFLLFSLAVLGAAWIGGLGPGLLATFLSAVLYLYVANRFSPDSPISIFIKITLFGLEGVAISLLAHHLTLARRLRVLGVLSEQKRSQEALGESEARKNAILETALDAIITIDHQDKLIEFNPAAEHIFGYSRAEVIGKPMAELIIPFHLRERHYQGLAHYLNTGEGPVLGRRIELPAMRSDGSEFPAELAIVPIKINGSPPIFTAFLRDITRRTTTERELRESGERFRFLAESMPQKIFTGTPAGEIDYFNRQWMEFTGLSFEQIKDWGWTQFIHPEDVEENVRRWKHSIDTGEPFQFEHRFRRADGEYRWHLSRAHAMRDSEGKVLMWIGSNTEIDDIKQAERERDQLLAGERAARSEAERTNRMKDEFLSTLSHELRTPLNAILGWSQLLRSGGMDEDDVAQGLETIERNARVQAQLIEDLLDMSRIISGKVRLDVQRVDLSAIIEGAMESVRPAAAGKEIRLQRVLDPIGGKVAGDPARLQQVIWNLLSNAIKFTPKGGRVQVLLERVNSHVEITVSDTGQGIKPEFLPHVFERFRQADASTTRQHGGMGLGLSIVKNLIELHGGTVWAKSPGEGQGSTFVVMLPLTVAHPEPLESAREHPRAISGTHAVCDPPMLKGVKVMVVDDEPDARELVRRILVECEADVVTAASAAEALQIIERERPHVLVSDIGMPEKDGYSLIRQIRAMGADRGGDVPAVALTAFARSEDRRRSLQAGFQMHVAKPVEPAELIAVIASLAGRTGREANSNDERRENNQ